MKTFKELKESINEARKYSVLDTKKNQIVSRPNITKAAAQKLVDKDPENRIMGSPEFIHDKRTAALKESLNISEASSKSQYWIYDPKSNTTITAVDSKERGRDELETFKRTRKFSGGANYVMIDFGQPEYVITGHKVDKKATPFKIVK